LIRFLKAAFLKTAPAILVTLVFIIYLFTLAPTIIDMDCGELVTVQCTLGIAHPSGYPFFTLVGYLFSRIPIETKPAILLNVLNAFWSTLAVLLFFLSLRYFLRNSEAFGKISETRQSKKILQRGLKGEKKIAAYLNSLSELQITCIAFLCSCALAFGLTFWQQSAAAEVYSLNIALLCLLILMTFKAIVSYADSKDSLFNWIAVGLCSGILLANHLTFLFVLPGFIYLYFTTFKLNKKSITRFCTIVFTSALSAMCLYIYLPARSGCNPLLNWSQPVDFISIIYHISGKSYHHLFFTSFDNSIEHITAFVKNLPYELGVLLLFFPSGLYFLRKYSTRLLIFFTLPIVFTFFFAFNYTINDIEAYYLQGFVFCAIISSFGIVFLIQKGSTFSKYVIYAGLPLFVLIQAGVNYRNVDQSNNYLFEDYPRAVLQYLPKNSILYAHLWDSFISPSYYLQFVEHYRNDVVVIDTKLLTMDWYFNQLSSCYGKFYESGNSLIEDYKQNIRKYDLGINDDKNALDVQYKNVMQLMLTDQIKDNHCFISPEIFQHEFNNGDLNLPRGYVFVPDILSLRITKDTTYIPARNPDFIMRFPARESHNSIVIKNLVTGMLARRALYEVYFNKFNRAKVYVARLKSISPDYPLPQALVKFQ
jgi:hypothetical protein